MISLYFKTASVIRQIGIVLLLIGSVTITQAQQKKPIDKYTLKMAANDPLAKIGPELAALQKIQASKNNAHTQKANSQIAFTSQNLLQIQGEYVVIEAVAEGNQTAQLLADLTALGMVQPASFGRMVSGLMPIRELTRVAALKNMRFARPAYKPQHNIGQVTSQGDVAMYADSIRKEQRIKGQGSKIGVLSDSYNSQRGAEKGINSGDLPGKGNPNGYTTPIQVLQDLGVKDIDQGRYSDEGRGMLEIIHDVAPAAQLAFHTAFRGQASFAQGILNLKQAGCNIITDDVYYLNEPMFQDGIISQAIDQVEAEGISYFTAVGNNGRDAYQTAFNSGGPISVGSKFKPGGLKVVDAHNFAPDGQKPDLVQRIFVPVGATVTFSFQYSQPYYSVGNGKSPGAASDLDIYLLTEDTTNIITGSINYNVGNDPVEVFSFRNNGDYGSNYFNLLIDKVSGPAPAIIKYIVLNSNISIEEYGTRSSSIIGHSNAKGAISTGAVFFGDTPAYGNNLVAESFSTAGGSPTLFNVNGERITPEIRQKPDIMAPDGTFTSFFGFPFQGNYYFFGTSAAAPHAAAVAALMQESAGNTLSPDKIRQVMRQTATDMNEPGFDFDTGYGFINAFAAVETVAKPRIRYFALINPQTGKVMQTINEGDEINLTRLPSRQVLIRAYTGPDRVGSVALELNNQRVIENLAPYDYPGSQDNVITLTEQDYTITAVPYTQAKGGGEAGLPLTVRFKAVEEKIVRFELIDVAENKVLKTLQALDILYLPDLPTNLSIRAITSPGQVGSVQFDLNGKTTTENIPPYDLAGSSGGSLDLKPGIYTLSAATYPNTKANGTIGDTKTIYFGVVTSLSELAALPDNLNTKSNGELTVTPNPFAQQAKIRFSVPQTGNATLSIHDLNGAPVAELHNGLAQAGQLYEYTLDGASLPAGWYIGRVITDKGIFYQKLRLTK